MPTTASFQPAYRHYKPKNLAVVRIRGKDVYLGKFDSPESWRKYHQAVADLLAAKDECAGGVALATPASLQPTSLKRLCLAYIEFAERYYVKRGVPVPPFLPATAETGGSNRQT